MTTASAHTEPRMTVRDFVAWRADLTETRATSWWAASRSG
jgi:hypothetical protein